MNQFDVTTSTKLGEFENELPPGHRWYEKEALYQRPDGVFFIAGRGGAASKYDGGESAWAVSAENAARWLDRLPHNLAWVAEARRDAATW